VKAKLAALLTVLAFYGAVGLPPTTRESLIRGGWYLLVGDLWNIPVTTDQPIAGLILWGAALPPLATLAIARRNLVNTSAQRLVRGATAH